MFAVVALVICGILCLLALVVMVLIGIGNELLGGMLMPWMAVMLGAALQCFVGASLAQTWVNTDTNTKALAELTRELVRLAKRQAGESEVTAVAGD